MNNVNEQRKQKQTHRCREQPDGCHRGGNLGDWIKQVKGVRLQIGSYKRVTGM